MASATPYPSCADFKHVFSSAYCDIVSNSPHPVLPPDDSGLDSEDDRPFHLGLLRERIWGCDDFWYLALLPRCLTFKAEPLFQMLAVPFDDLPINKVAPGVWQLAPAFQSEWLWLEYHVVATYNVLKEAFGSLVPLKTKLPPCPRTTRFWATHTEEDEARRAVHRARRLFFPWLCLVSVCILKSPPNTGSGPSKWFKLLASLSPPLDAYWLDNIASSRIVTCFDHTMPRRGLCVNMVPDWSFWRALPVLDYSVMPIWLCFPHGGKFKTRLAMSLKPAPAALALAKESVQGRVVYVDNIRTIPPPGKELLDTIWSNKAALSSPTPSSFTAVEDDPLGFDDALPPHSCTIESVLDLSSLPSRRTVPDVAELTGLAYAHNQVDPFVDVLKFRYGIVLPALLSTPTSCIGRGACSRDLLNVLRGMVQEHALHDSSWQDPAVIQLVEMFGVSILGGNVVSPDVSDCHQPEEAFYSLRDVWNLCPRKARLRQLDTEVYILRAHDNTVSACMLAIKDVASVREVLRRGLGPSCAHIVQQLIARGIPVLPMSTNPPLLAPTPFQYVAHVYRPQGYVFKSEDYVSYARRRVDILKDIAVSRRAIMTGGIVWRLTMESDVDLEACCTTHANEDVYQTLVVEAGRSEWVVPTLPDSVADTIVGMYKLYTGSGEQTADVSWWPKKSIWDSSGFNCGHWTSECEEWFSRRVKDIKAGVAVPRTAKEWRGALRLRASTTRLMMTGLCKSHGSVETE